jgi:hypothetical protein
MWAIFSLSLAAFLNAVQRVSTPSFGPSSAFGHLFRDRQRNRQVVRVSRKAAHPVFMDATRMVVVCSGDLGQRATVYGCSGIDGYSDGPATWTLGNK